MFCYVADTYVHYVMYTFFYEERLVFFLIYLIDLKIFCSDINEVLKIINNFKIGNNTEITTFSADIF